MMPLTKPAGNPRIPPADRSRVILVAEDEDELREMVARTLEAQGHEVLQARHGAEAFDMAAKAAHPIDLLVTDLMMPFLDGATLAQLIQSQHPRIQVLYMTGYPTGDLQKWEVLDASMPRLQKPFSLRDLVRIVEGLLRD
jgi:two-component system cell cycle sensor histidine kinase/response regulator CckA